MLKEIRNMQVFVDGLDQLMTGEKPKRKAKVRAKPKMKVNADSGSKLPPIPE
jgi:hypothetical protein